ncbi:hypothetical protein ASE49_12770 [Novosphingobium sp. Leaf2]|nr:hypothetical protein ASE49_12770 [Novosphingobium sp. Leaf2]
MPAVGGFEVGDAGDGTPFTGLTGFQPTNAEFVATIFTQLPESARPIVTGKAGDPQTGGWRAQWADELDQVCRDNLNTYFNCASFMPDEDGMATARKEHAAAFHALVLDDVGTKVDRELIGTIEPTWELETSPGNFQMGFKLTPPLHEAGEVDHLQQKIAKAGVTDQGSLGMSRWMRLPQGINGKPKYGTAERPFHCRLHRWNPNVSYAASELLAILAPTQDSVDVPRPTTPPAPASNTRDGVYMPRSDEHPVVAAFKAQGLYKRMISAGKHDVTCPWAHEHTDQADSGSAYFEPDSTHPNGGFCCQHSHRESYRIGKILEHFGLTTSQARNRSTIRVVGGEMHNVVDAAEAELAKQQNVFQAGGLIVKAMHDGMTGDWGLKPLSEADVALMLSRACDWEKFGTKGSWVRCDPSTRHVINLCRAGEYHHLLPIKGLARQPYYRDGDGVLLTASGYDTMSQRLGLFDGAKFPPVERTESAARAALARLEALLGEFHFAESTDKAAALSAVMTAVVRPSIDLAPAFHVKAPAPGSGKSYLCELISLFAGPGTPARMSYPKTSEEATKSIIAVLLGGPAVVEFDDMDTDWLPHGAINRMLTSRWITDRILGQSKTATVSTNTLVLGSGNNVGPLRDLSRRVLTINLNTRAEIPGTISYQANPVAALRCAREQYVMDVLTIVEAWRGAGSPRSSVSAIASYGGAWADHCRHPLIWLGLPDPASNLLQQMQSDPDADLLKALLKAWHAKHGINVVTVRRLLDGDYGTDLQEALNDLPVFDRGQVNRSKLGWYLRRNMNRVVGGFVLEQVDAAERKAWKVVKLEAGEPASPPLPPPASDRRLEALF